MKIGGTVRHERYGILLKCCSSKSLITLAILSTIASGCGASSGAAKTDSVKAVVLTTNQPPPLTLPSKIERLVNIVPEDASIVVHLQSGGLFEPSLDGKTPALSRQTIAAVLSDTSGLPTSFTGELLGSVEEAIFFSKTNANENRDHSPLASSCIGARFQSEERFDSLLEQIAGKRQPDGRLEATRDGRVLHGAWVHNARVAIVCTTAEMFETSLSTAKSDETSFSASTRFRIGHENDTWASVDLHQVTHGDKGVFEPGSHVFATLPRNAPTSIDLSFVGHGDGYPRMAELFAATNHATLAQFPQGAAVAFGLSIERRRGKTVTDVVHEIERLGGSGLGESIGHVLSEFGIDLGNLDAALGNEIAFGVYSDAKFTTTAADMLKHKGILIAIPTANEAAAKKVLQSILTAIKKQQNKKKTSIFTAESMSADLGDDNQLRVERKNGVVLITVGDKKFTATLVGKFGNARESLGASAEFEQTRNAAKSGHLLGYVDATMLAKMAGEDFNENPLGLAQTKPQLLTLTFQPMDRGMGVDLHSHVSTIGFASAVAIFGVNRYLKNAKTAEAKTMLGHIARNATAAYERESLSGPSHALCKSAIAVPSSVPAAKKYKPFTTDGKDFDTGDQRQGWRCLKFNVETPMYYQYEYRAGGPYKGPTRGGPDPGPNGFEVSAEGDLDGDGKTSLFTLVGSVENGVLKRAPQIFIVDEFE